MKSLARASILTNIMPMSSGGARNPPMFGVRPDEAYDALCELLHFPPVGSDTLKRIRRVFNQEELRYIDVSRSLFRDWIEAQVRRSIWTPTGPSETTIPPWEPVESSNTTPERELRPSNGNRKATTARTSKMAKIPFTIAKSRPIKKLTPRDRSKKAQPQKSRDQKSLRTSAFPNLKPKPKDLELSAQELREMSEELARLTE